MLRILPSAAALTLAFALAPPPAHAQRDPACGGACARLLDEGMALSAQGKLADALAKFKEASAAAPTASPPLSAAAHVYTMALPKVKPEQVDVIRKQAEGLARAALKLAPGDPVAQEVLRTLADATPSPLHRANAAAETVLLEAELLFSRRQYPQALEKYEQAMRLDPQHAGAWVGAGDCWFMQQQWDKAEAMFRRATAIEPRNGQAWRFLADALFHQRRIADAEAALLSGIAADPSQLPSWTKLASVRSQAGLPLKPLGLRRPAVRIGADGKAVIEIDEALQKTDTTFDGAMRLGLAAGEATARTATAGPRQSPFEIELAAWKLAFTAADEMSEKSGEKPTDPALLAMQRMQRDGQLEPAVFVLLYREAYRPEYERWLAAHPGGVKAFIDRYGLRP